MSPHKYVIPRFKLRLWLEDETFREGKKVEIFFGERPAVKLLSGKIAGLEPDLQEEQPEPGRARLRPVPPASTAAAIAAPSTRSPTRTWPASSPAKPDCGRARSTASSEVHEYVFQNNQTNAEFLRERARRLGYELWVEDDALHFRRPAPNGQPVTLAWGDNLRSFRARLSTAEQVNEVEVRGWDPKQKREVVGRATQGTGAPEIGLSQSGADVARSAWGEAEDRDRQQGRAVAGRGGSPRSVHARRDGLVVRRGRGDLRRATPTSDPGRQVEIKGVGQRFGGTYYVTQVVHTWNKRRGHDHPLHDQRPARLAACGACSRIGQPPRSGWGWSSAS